MNVIAIFTNPRALAYIATDFANKARGKAIVTQEKITQLSQILANHTYRIKGVFVLKLQCEHVPASIKTSAVAIYRDELPERPELVAIEEPNAIYRAIAEEAQMPVYDYLIMYRKEALEK